MNKVNAAHKSIIAAKHNADMAMVITKRLDSDAHITALHHIISAKANLQRAEDALRSHFET